MLKASGVWLVASFQKPHGSSRFLHLEYGDDITTFHYHVGGQLGCGLLKLKLVSDRLEGARGSLDVQRS